MPSNFPNDHAGAELALNPEAELARLRERVSELEHALVDKALQETTLSLIAKRNGGVVVGFEGGICHLIGGALAAQFFNSKATNYIEMHLESDEAGPLVVTLQRQQGKTPHDLRLEAEARAEALEKEAARGRYVAAHGEWHRCGEPGVEPADECYGMLVVRVPYETDLSCRPTREDALDALIRLKPVPDAGRTLELVRNLQAVTGQGMMDCRRALKACAGDPLLACGYVHAMGLAVNVKGDRDAWLLKTAQWLAQDYRLTADGLVERVSA
ncbi:hypothetical protein [Geopseudomonas aromaticivorans]